MALRGSSSPPSSFNRRGVSPAWATSGSCSCWAQNAASLALVASTSSGAPAATWASMALRAAALLCSRYAASATIRSGAAIALRAVSLRVMVLPKVTCQSTTAPLPTSNAFNACASKDGAPSRPCTCKGAASCTCSGTGPWASTWPAALSTRACSSRVSATGGSQRTVASVPGPTAWPGASASRCWFSSSNCSFHASAPGAGLRRSVKVKARPSASWRGNSSVMRGWVIGSVGSLASVASVASVALMAGCHCNGRAGRSCHTAALRPSPTSRMAAA